MAKRQGHPPLCCDLGQINRLTQTVFPNNLGQADALGHRLLGKGIGADGIADNRRFAAVTHHDGKAAIHLKYLRNQNNTSLILVVHIKDNGSQQDQSFDHLLVINANP